MHVWYRWYKGGRAKIVHVMNLIHFLYPSEELNPDVTANEALFPCHILKTYVCQDRESKSRYSLVFNPKYFTVSIGSVRDYFVVSIEST